MFYEIGAALEAGTILSLPYVLPHTSHTQEGGKDRL
jgi:hypothetical protein